MEDSKKGERSGKKGLSTPDPHVDGGNGKKVMVSNTKEGKKEGGQGKKTKKKRERKKKRKK